MINKLYEMSIEAGFTDIEAGVKFLEKLCEEIRADERKKLLSENGYLGEQLQAHITAEQNQCAKICEDAAKSYFNEAEFDSIHGSLALNQAGRALMGVAKKIRNRIINQ